MIRLFPAAVLLLLGVVCLVPDAKSIPLRSVSIESLTTGADLITLGRIVNIVKLRDTAINLPSGEIPATAFRASLHVDQILKGGPHQGSLLIDFLIPQQPIGFQGVSIGQYGIFFLKNTADGWEFLEPEYPLLPAVRHSELSPAPLLDQIAVLLGQVLGSPQATESDNIRALDALGNLQTDVSKQVLRQAFNNSSGNLRLTIAGMLIAHNDITGLAAVVSALLHPAGLPQNLVLNLAGALSGLKDPRAVPGLSTLAAMKNKDDVHRFAAAALRQTGSPAAIAPLSQLLDDPDLLTRYYSVVGLGEITAQDAWTPAFDEFQQNQKHYLSHWRAWRANNAH